MRVEVKHDLGNRKIYRKKLLSEQAIFYIYCFAYGFVIAMMIAVAIFN
mgnify:CR=1 FL=1